MSLRLWVGILTLTAFLAGLACGPFASTWLVPAKTATDATPFPDYERMLVDTFHLGPDRREPLRTLLGEYRREIERIKDRHMADYMSAMEPELREKGLHYRDLIRNKVLPEPSRPEFDRLCLDVPATQAPH
jgi:hypothetical protein